uniref:Reverse transcriptase zinc-binding domain-containing protein n=1 Tax=Tanacetum cinerariifolium TaxID=118510 RepID=A0A6L2ME65_TANCI|nr:reverse transcriptase zinc-binding domain-containing protein [Tanacetum cinerariifolium]
MWCLHVSVAVQIVLWIVDSGFIKHMTGDHTLLENFVEKFIGDDLLTGARESKLYTISISDMAASSPVYLISKATSTKSWLWHHRLSHLNFSTINDLTKLDVVDGLLKFKYSKDHLCSACGLGLRSLEKFNMALMSTHIWNIVSNKESIWVKWIHTYKHRGRSFWDISMKADVSWGWLKLLQLREFLTCGDITREGFSLHDCVIDMVSNDGWKWPQSWLLKAPDLGLVLLEVYERRLDLLGLRRKSLKTQDNLRPWDVRPDVDLSCLRYTFYDLQPNSHDHLFFACSFSSQVWKYVRHLADMDSIQPCFHDIVAYLQPMAKKRMTQKFSDVSINSAAQQVHNHEDSPLTSSIIIEEHEAPPIVTTSEEQTSPILMNEADELNQEDSAEFDGNTLLNLYDAPNFAEAESSTTTLDPSNMHKFYQVQPSTHILEKSSSFGISNCTFEPKNIKEAMSDHSWIESMQDELHKFKRLDAWELVPTPDGKNIIAVKWLWKNNDNTQIIHVFGDVICIYLIIYHELSILNSLKLLAGSLEDIPSRFFPPALFDRLLGEIRAFSQHENESLTDASLRMKEMLRNCHGHNLSKGNIIKIFYHGLSEITQEVLNAAAGVAKNHTASIQNPKTKFDRLADKQSGRPSGSLPSNTQPKPQGGKAYQPPQARNEHVNVVFPKKW